MKDKETSENLGSGKRCEVKRERRDNDGIVVQNLHLKDINIDSLIRMIRGQKVMVDFDLAMLYGVKNKRLNEQVKRNIERFPDDFMFQLTKEEFMPYAYKNESEGSFFLEASRKISKKSYFSA